MEKEALANHVRLPSVTSVTFSRCFERDSLSVLDVGCGDNPKGTVNCDFNVGQTLEGGDQKRGKKGRVNPQKREVHNESLS